MIDKAVCHHCGHKNKIIKDCKIDGKKCEFLMYGPGVEKVYEELKKLSSKNIKIFSSDYLSQKNKTIIKEIENNKIDILIGTQMISKGFNFPYLNCIVVVDADFTGKGYDLRTTEKIYNFIINLVEELKKFHKIVYHLSNCNPIQSNFNKYYRK